MNMIKKYTGRTLWLGGLMLTALMAGCSSGSGSSSSSTVPTVVETAPANEATNVSINSKVTAIFSEEMDESTINTTDTAAFTNFTVIAADGYEVRGAVQYDAESKTAIFTPDAGEALARNTLYTATVTTAVKSATGVALAADYGWTFTTGDSADSTAPTVGANSTYPANGAIDIPVNRDVTATFSEALLASTVNKTTFTLTNGTTAVAGDVTYSNMVATFNPTTDLATDTPYTATLTTGITDLAGNALVADYVWSFTTSASAVVAKGPAPVNLGKAGDFVILAKTAITGGTSDITGDIGLSPETAAAITSVDCTNMLGGTIYGVDAGYTGTCYVKDPVGLTTAVSNMETAYTDAAGRTVDRILNLGAGKIGGLVLEPGLYYWESSVTIAAGTNVTLKGGPKDVWILQMTGNLTQADSTEVILDGALPENVFWQVAGEGATIGTSAIFKGVVLAQKAITLTTGASAKGRLLAQSAVTLSSSPVTEP